MVFLRFAMLFACSFLMAYETSDFDKLIHKNTYLRDEIIEYARCYSLENYQIYPCQTGIFYIEKDYPTDCYDPKRAIVVGHGWDLRSVSLMSQYVVPGTTVIDVGANIGSLTNVLCDFVGPSGKVLAFEPIPSFFSELCWNMLLNGRKNVELYWAALSSKHEFHELEEMNWKYLAKDFSKPVEFLPLDSLDLTNVSLIKVDIECMEDQFILGAIETLKRCKPVLLIELMGGHSYEAATGPIREQIIYRMQLLESLGYTVTPLGGHDYLALPSGK